MLSLRYVNLYTLEISLYPLYIYCKSVVLKIQKVQRNMQMWKCVSYTSVGCVECQETMVTAETRSCQLRNMAAVKELFACPFLPCTFHTSVF